MNWESHGFSRGECQIDYIKTVSLDKDGKEGQISFGYTILDDYEDLSDTTFQDFESLKEYLNKETILNVFESNWSITEGLLYAIREKGGLYFNDEWLSLDELELVRRSKHKLTKSL